MINLSFTQFTVWTGPVFISQIYGFDFKVGS